MKKLLSFMLIAMLVISTLACGCTKKTADNEQSTTGSEQNTTVTVQSTENDVQSSENDSQQTEGDTENTKEPSEDYSDVESSGEDNVESTEHSEQNTKETVENVTDNSFESTKGTEEEKTTANKTTETTTENKTTQVTTTKSPVTETTKATTPQTTEAPTTKAPTTEAPTTKAPVEATTEAPVVRYWEGSNIPIPTAREIHDKYYGYDKYICPAPAEGTYLKCDTSDELWYLVDTNENKVYCLGWLFENEHVYNKSVDRYYYEPDFNAWDEMKKVFAPKAYIDGYPVTSIGINTVPQEICGLISYINDWSGKTEYIELILEMRYLGDYACPDREYGCYGKYSFVIPGLSSAIFPDTVTEVHSVDTVATGVSITVPSGVTKWYIGNFNGAHLTFKNSIDKVFFDEGYIWYTANEYNPEYMKYYANGDYGSDYWELIGWGEGHIIYFRP